LFVLAIAVDVCVVYVVLVEAEVIPVTIDRELMRGSFFKF
jgi:hypothetical protein